MSVDSFSKGIVEIISSSKDAERVENEIAVMKGMLQQLLQK